jgi:hypothetical protein
MAVGLLLSATRMAQQPATHAAFFSGFTALARFGSTVGEALLITAQTLITHPVGWGLPVCAIGLVVAWALAVRKFVVGVPA